MGDYVRENKAPDTQSYVPGNDVSPLLSSLSAPWYFVSNTEAVSIEHPYIIKNVEKGIESLGGSPGLNKLVMRDADVVPQASLYQRPGNRLTKPLYSHNVRTNNIILKIGVPKRTCLKRKPSSKNTSYESSAHDRHGQQQPTEGRRDIRKFLRSLRDNPSNYQIEAMGTINQTHRFRNLPDFAQSSTESPFMRKMKDNILTFDYVKVKEFRLDMSKGAKPNTEIIPPPTWSQHQIPLNYAYRQNPGVKSTIDAEGNTITRNTQLPPKIHAPPIPFNAPSVPTGPAPELPPISSLEPTMQRLIATARSLMADRPIFTRRSLPNCMPGNEWQALGRNATKFLYQYIGYMFASGPWRDAVVRFGLDPRTDPQYRIYQTMMFVLDAEPKDNRAKHHQLKPKPPQIKTPPPITATGAQEIYLSINEKETHLFNGETLSRDGKIWQVCDITEPVLHEILFSTTNLRETCHIESDGWYHNGTWAKAKTIMKWKITTLLTGVSTLTDFHYTRVANDMPCIIPRSSKLLGGGAEGGEGGRGGDGGGATTAAAKLTFKDPLAEEKTLASQIRTASLSQYRVEKGNRLAPGQAYSNREDEEEEEVEEGREEHEGEERKEGDAPELNIARRGGIGDVDDDDDDVLRDYEDEPVMVENGRIDPNLENAMVLEAMRDVDMLGGRSNAVG